MEKCGWFSYGASGETVSFRGIKPTLSGLSLSAELSIFNLKLALSGLSLGDDELRLGICKLGASPVLFAL